MQKPSVQLHYDVSEITSDTFCNKSPELIVSSYSFSPPHTVPLATSTPISLPQSSLNMQTGASEAAKVVILEQDGQILEFMDDHEAQGTLIETVPHCTTL